MQPITSPELQGLVAIAREQGLDMKPILLRVLTDLYVAADHHTADEVTQFEDIAGTLAGQVDRDAALIAACKLAAYPATPMAVGEAFVARGDDAARIILADAAWLPRTVVLAQAATGDRVLAAAVAARTDVDPALGRLLLARRDPLIDTTLAANTTVALAEDVKQELLARACEEEAIASALLSRTVLAGTDRAVLFLRADKAGRRAIIDEMETVALTSGRSRQTRAAPPEIATGLETAAMSGDESAFVSLLALGLGSHPAKVRRLVDDRTGEALAVALVALGISDEVMTRIFMFRDPLIGHSTQKLFGLIDLARRVSWAAAHLITMALLGLAPREARPSSTAASAAAGSPVRRAAETATQQHPATAQRLKA
jgi:uncharacterized protein (DUF2336 family)